MGLAGSSIGLCGGDGESELMPQVFAKRRPDALGSSPILRSSLVRETLGQDIRDERPRTDQSATPGPAPRHWASEPSRWPCAVDARRRRLEIDGNLTMVMAGRPVPESQS